MTSIATLVASALYIVCIVLDYLRTEWFDGQLALFERQATAWAKQNKSQRSESITSVCSKEDLEGNVADHDDDCYKSSL